jgi:spore photoproduct lyase
MTNTQPYTEKFAHISQQTPLRQLPAEQQAFVKETAFKHRFTMQELRQFIEITLDLNNWDETDITGIWSELDNKQGSKKVLLQQLQTKWLQLKSEPNRYGQPRRPVTEPPQLTTTAKEQIALGFCPVASEKTRCCNLLTLDAVENCGFDCSYCSIQSFYHGNRVIFDSNFAANLSRLELDPSKSYHIGTGQSSDSLMWGNKHGLLDALIRFTESHPNVILELKTKSANIQHLLEAELPPNIICTWSLNTQTVIDHEEHQTASLQRRLAAARKVADAGSIIGFHFHPIVQYAGWRDDYSQIYAQVQEMFEPSEVAMISIGTLTFIKPVLKKIRERGIRSKILKMPMIETAGKLSYPQQTKLELFTHAYSSFSRQWHDGVFFYLCMEDPALWKPVFGHEYQSNTEFEQAMKSSYLQKIGQRMQHR